jgi:putative glutamine amidotransferase
LIKVGLTQRVDVVPAYGERRDALDQNWARLLGELGCLVVPVPNLLPDPARFARELVLDALLLTGGNDLADAEYRSPDAAPERDALELALIDVFQRAAKPVLGVCRGAQILNKFHGGSLVRVQAHVAARHRIRPTPDGGGSVEEREVNSYHNFGILPSGLAPGLTATALAEDGTVESFHHRDLPHWGIMWHPERERPFVPTDLAFIKQILQSTQIQ